MGSVEAGVAEGAVEGFASSSLCLLKSHAEGSVLGQEVLYKLRGLSPMMYFVPETQTFEAAKKGEVHGNGPLHPNLGILLPERSRRLTTNPGAFLLFGAAAQRGTLPLALPLHHGQHPLLAEPAAPLLQNLQGLVSEKCRYQSPESSVFPSVMNNYFWLGQSFVLFFLQSSS